jgi:hypothetical protein
MYDGPRIVDEVNPTQDEIRAWADSGADEPVQDWDIVIAEPENLQLLLDLVGDPECPSRRYLQGSMYCLVGHSDHADPRLMSAAVDAEAASDTWVSAWGRRVRHVLTHPSDFKRDDWCGWQGFRVDPED